jgi:histone demethylase JARID1
LTVHYAADIPSSKYFTKKELYDLINEEKSDPNENFNLMKVNVLKNSLLQFSKKDCDSQISGITIPWFYYGMLYSSFCWHTEDLYLYSLNYMHEGASKIWYSISHTDKERMDEYVRNKYFATLLKQPDLLHRLTVHINPLELIQHGIKVYKVVQNPGDMIITIPKGYHCGFSTGFNLAEAVNFSVSLSLLIIRP